VGASNLEEIAKIAEIEKPKPKLLPLIYADER